MPIPDNLTRYVCKRNRADDYIAYCPKCGRLYIVIHEVKGARKYCKHCKIPGIFKEHPAECITTDETIGQNFPNDETSWSDSSGFTIEMYEYMWNKYVCVPENTQLDKTEFNAFKDEITIYLANGGADKKPTQLSYTCPKCGFKSSSPNTQKQGFSVGKAAVGVVAAGPVGAAAGAIGMNKEKRVCPNCGYKW